MVRAGRRDQPEGLQVGKFILTDRESGSEYVVFFVGLIDQVTGVHFYDQLVSTVADPLVNSDSLGVAMGGPTRKDLPQCG